MVMYNELTFENRIAIRNRASKPDGVYTFRGIIFRVVKGVVTHFASKGQIVIPCGNFDVSAGTYLERHLVVKDLKALNNGRI